MEQDHLNILLIVAGAALCLAGWVLFWVGSRLVGCALGLGFGFVFGIALSAVMQLEGPTRALIMLSCSCLGALGGLLFIRAVTTLLFVCAGFLFGALLGRVGAAAWFAMHHRTFVPTNPNVIAVVLSCGALSSVLAVWFQKLVVSVITSFVGATFLATGMPLKEKQQIWVLLGVFVVALLWQLGLAAAIGKRPATPQK